MFRGKTYDAWEKNSHWKANYPVGMDRLAKAGRIHVAKNSIQYVRYHSDFDAGVHGNIWTDTGTGNFTDDKLYVVQTNSKVIQRCILMTTDPGDLVLDPTCGSGTTACVAEQWGRRDHHRHLARRSGAGACPNHGCTLSLLPASVPSQK